MRHVEQRRDGDVAHARVHRRRLEHLEGAELLEAVEHEQPVVRQVELLERRPLDRLQPLDRAQLEVRVPAHDERDHAFATCYGLPIIQVVAPAEGDAVDVSEAAWPAKEATVTVNSGDFSGLDFKTAFDRIAQHIEDHRIGERKVNYRLRDWGVSRQRYWGCPVPVIYCPDCGTVPVPDEDLPVVLPEDVTFMGVQSPIKADPEWRKTRCPECGQDAERETDTFDTFVESSWYYARYCTPNAEGMLDQRADYWLPVDHYIGGIEHAVLHLMYFRFWHKLMRDLDLVSSDEPATQLLCQGMVLAEAYYHDSAEQGRVWVRPDEVQVEKDGKGKTTTAQRMSDGAQLTATGWTTMSKSKNNGVDPQSLVDRYGADTVRLFTMFASPPDQALEWNDDAVAGSQRFLRRLWTLVHIHHAILSDDAGAGAQLDEAARDLRRVFHGALQKISRDMERHHQSNHQQHHHQCYYYVFQHHHQNHQQLLLKKKYLQHLLVRNHIHVEIHN